MADGFVAREAKAATEIVGRADYALLIFDGQEGLRKWMLFKFNQ